MTTPDHFRARAAQDPLAERDREIRRLRALLGRFGAYATPAWVDEEGKAEPSGRLSAPDDHPVLCWGPDRRLVMGDFREAARAAGPDAATETAA